MGVTLCSCKTRSSIDNFYCTEEMVTSDEEEDTDGDEFFNLGKMGRCVTMPDELRQVLQGPSKPRKIKSWPQSRSEECLMEKKMKDWPRSSVLNPEGELQAKRYSKMVTNDSLRHLRETIRTASSIVDKGTSINDELARQERVLSKAENDIAIAEYDTDQTTETLKGMKSLKGKLASVIWKKEPKLRINKFNKETSAFSNVNLSLLNEDVGLCAFSKMQSSKVSSLSKDMSEDTVDKQQTQIKAGIGQLHEALDAITLQQMDTAYAIDKQDGRLSVFDNRISTTHQKINCQTQMIKSIMGN